MNRLFLFKWKTHSLYNFNKITIASEGVADKVTEDNNNILKADKATTDAKAITNASDDGNSSTLHDSIMQHLDKGIVFLNDDNIHHLEL